MSELERIADQLRRTLEGEAWHGPAVLELLAGVTPEQAAARPISGVSSIWQLVLHLIGTYRLVLRRIDGDATPLSLEEDWPDAPEPTAENWQHTIKELRTVNEQAQRTAAAFDVAKLDWPLVANPPYSAYLQLIGLTQHDLYHAGQIAVLKRAMATEQSAGK